MAPTANVALAPASAVCGDGCVVIKAPSEKELRDYVYKVDSSCYRYTPNVVDCGSAPR